MQQFAEQLADLIGAALAEGMGYEEIISDIEIALMGLKEQEAQDGDDE